MRKTVIAALVLLALPLCGWHALPGDILLGEKQWSLAANIRVSTITIKEYVLAKNMTYVLSRLDWKLKWIETNGIDLSYQLNPKWIFSLGANLGKLAPPGTMDDYDWAKKIDFNHYSYDGVWSDYSHHENKMRHFLAADINLFYHTGKTTRFYAGCGFLYKVIAMDGVNGYYRHTDPYNPASTPVTNYEYSGDWSGHAISYTHHSFVPYFGAGLRQAVGSRLFVKGFFLVTPFTWAIGKDTHWTSYPAYDAKYTDYLEWDLYLFFSLKIGFALSRRTTLSLGWEMVYQPRAEGNTKVEPWGGGSVVYADTGGGSFMSHSLLLRGSFRL